MSQTRAIISPTVSRFRPISASQPGDECKPLHLVREYEVLAERATLATRIDGVVNPPWGVAGGIGGGSGRAVVNPGTANQRVLAPLSDGNLLVRGDILLLETGGGGGRGHPFDRPAETVLGDVLDGFVSPEAATAQYGVVIAAGDVDKAATTRRRADRPVVGAFHRRSYVEHLD